VLLGGTEQKSVEKLQSKATYLYGNSAEQVNAESLTMVSRKCSTTELTAQPTREDD